MAIPLYRQIAADLSQRIQSGELEPTHHLPAQPDLRQKYNASENTSSWLDANPVPSGPPGPMPH